MDLARREITVRDGKGRKDRVTVLPDKLARPLRAHLERVRRQHEYELSDGLGSVSMPGELARKYPRADRTWCWQWVFPATRHHEDRSTGELRRHESVIQREFAIAVRAAGLTKPATCHTLRHYAGSRIMPGLGHGLRATWDLGLSRSA
ncbi:MAG: tyrosine-type recombinase/integrase [Planctomycetota bacterium]